MQEKILLKSVLIIDSSSPFNGQVKDVLIEEGIIKNIDNAIAAPGARTIEEKGLCVSPGWMDMQVNFCDPGYEYKEDIDSGTKAAAAGGFTAVCTMSSTNPPIHSKGEVEYIRNKTRDNMVDVFPVGTVSHKLEGEDLSEMYDMHLSGAVAFSDDKKSLSNAGLLLRALLYAKNFGGLVMTHCDEKSISNGGKMNEGINSTLLGLKGIPALAEELMLSRNLFIAEYAESPIHISNVSTKKSVELIRQAKSKGLKVTASVNVINLILDDSALKTFDSHYKVNPPLRTPEDIAALKQGLKDGTIDCIASDHAPQGIEAKKVEFDFASNGVIGLQTAFALINTHLKGILSLEEIVQKLAVNPRSILRMHQPAVKQGEKATLTLFNPEKVWTLTEDAILSKSKNTPFIGTALTGKVMGIVNKGKHQIS